MRTKIVGLISALLLGTAVAACSATEADSSSSHWETCDDGNDCADVAGAVGCSGGYCVDSSGQKIDDGGSGGEDTDGASCDPFMAPVVDAELGTIVWAAEDAEGTAFVLESSEGADHLYVSRSGVLERVRILGSGTGVEPVTFTVVSFEHGGETVTLTFTTTDGTTAATLTEGVTKPGSPGGGTPTTLALLDEATVRAMPASTWVNTIVTEYYAEAEGGERIVVTRPEEEWDYEDFRLFYGGGTTLTERTVTNVARARDGGSTHIEFDLDGEAADVFFPNRLGTPEPTAGATLTVSGAESSVTRLEGEPGSDTLYECL